MKLLQNRWNQLPPRRRLLILALATWVCAVWATIRLLRHDGMHEVLYKAF